MSSTSVPDNRLLWVCANFRKFLNTSCFSCKWNSMLIYGNICYRFSHKYNTWNTVMFAAEITVVILLLLNYERER